MKVTPESIKKIYKALLLDDRWLKKREEILIRDNHTCIDCGSETQLQVHHTFYYTQFVHPWLYPVESLVTLCGDCHKKRHGSPMIYKESDSFVNELFNSTNYVKSIFNHISSNGKYSVGTWNFNSKNAITKHNRSLLTFLSIGILYDDIELVSFVHELFKKHPKYNSQYSKKTFLEVIEVDADKFDTYSNFVVLFDDGTKRCFSSNKCIDNIKVVK